ASEVGIIIAKDPSDVNENRDLIIERRSGQLKRISELHSAYLPLRFPLLYPYGEPGWHPKILFSGADWRPQDGNDNGEQRGEDGGFGENGERDNNEAERDRGADDGAGGAEERAGRARGMSARLGCCIASDPSNP